MSERYADRVEQAAQEALAEEVFTYFAQGAGAGVSAPEATAAWTAYRFLPRVLRDVTEVDVTTTLLGTDLRSLFAVAPTTLQRAAHPEGEVAMARAARAAGSLLVVSSNAGTRFEDIGATGVAWWLQMYVTADRGLTEQVVDTAVSAGARAVVLTADTPVVARKHSAGASVWDSIDPSWLRVNFSDPESTDAASEKATDLGPQDVDWLAKRFGVPVVVKGVLHPADARRCVDAGAAAIWVSNHGGRQLDRALATAQALGPVADEVGADAELYVDGGVRSGGDGLVAAALGARAVFLGRLPLYALADAGDEGVARLLGELTEELVESLRLAGVSSLSDAGRDLLH
jgi:4-hydroxymandelate oxidase